MPHTDAVASPGCPPLRALSFDNLGLIKVIESSTENGHPQVVARWGKPSSHRSIVSASLSSDEDCEVLAVARRNFVMEILDPSSGALYSEVNVRTADGLDNPPKILERKESVALIGVHLFRAEAFGSRAVLTCTDSGNASLQRFNMKLVDSERSHDDCTAASSWTVCNMGSILCMKVDRSEKYAAFGGDGADVTLWDIPTQSRIWEAKAPRRDSNGLMPRPFVTASTFLGNDHRKLIIGTGHHQVRLYDIGARRRPMMAFDFLESPIKAVEADIDGHTVFVGTGNGDLASFDMRSGKLLGTFKGKVSGSIRSIAVHPTLPVFATCGLDRFLRVYHKNSRQLLSQIFLKQPLVTTVFATKYPIQSPAVTDAEKLSVEGKTNPIVETEVHRLSVEKSKSQRIKGTKDEPTKFEHDAEDGLQPEWKTHKKRKSQKSQPGEQPLKVCKKKGDFSTLSSISAQVPEEDQMTLVDCAKPVELSECKRREKAISKLRKIKKFKQTV